MQNSAFGDMIHATGQKVQHFQKEMPKFVQNVKKRMRFLGYIAVTKMNPAYK